MLLFGGEKLPELTRRFINSIREFRSAYKEGNDPKNTDQND
jgi:Sec-independent protein translocase protein TatA